MVSVDVVQVDLAEHRFLERQRGEDRQRNAGEVERQQRRHAQRAAHVSIRSKNDIHGGRLLRMSRSERSARGATRPGGVGAGRGLSSRVGASAGAEASIAEVANLCARADVLVARRSSTGGVGGADVREERDPISLLTTR